MTRADSTPGAAPTPGAASATGAGPTAGTAVARGVDPATNAPPLRLSPVDRESTPALIARALRDAIACGDLRPGEQLAESRLAAQLGVSRGPLREAMQRLTQEGLLEGRRNRGHFVVELSDEAVRDVYLLRTALEESALRLIARGGDHARAGARLSAAAAAMEPSGAVESGQAVEPSGAVLSTGAVAPSAQASSATADLAFHRLLVELSGSPRLMRAHETVLVETSICLHAMGGSYRELGDRAAEHSRIASAIAAGDEAAALAALTEHMRDGLDRLLPADR